MVNDNLPKEVREEIKGVYWDIINKSSSEDNLESIFREIVKRHNVRYEDVISYYLRYRRGRRACTVIIFYNEVSRKAGNNRCFDYRIDSQFLPRDSVVIGTLFYTGQGAVAMPFVTVDQEENLYKILRDALDILGLTDAEIVDGSGRTGCPTLIIKMPESE